jgi:hypothetical protein
LLNESIIKNPPHKYDLLLNGFSFADLAIIAEKNKYSHELKIIDRSLLFSLFQRVLPC